ncbi:hypothetical protein ABT160_30055 [Streptomyces sp. NPDC001941]|uniref:hypothetical protein n=1 Tax=Streptomyces sp. NPDC001941 TaxID=3154659 RepID=UPI00332E1621
MALRTVVVLAAVWAAGAATFRWCWKTWRRGNDRLWADRWGSLGWTLLVTDLAVMTTLAALDVTQAVTELIAVGLFLAAGACAVGKSVAVRRADTATRSLRGSLGLPLARRLWRPGTVAVWWLTAGSVSMLTWLTVEALQSAHDARPAVVGTAEGTSLPEGFMTTGIVLVFLGLAHCVLQEERIRREQRRVRLAEQRYLDDSPPADPGPS